MSHRAEAVGHNCKVRLAPQARSALSDTQAAAGRLTESV